MKNSSVFFKPTLRPPLLTVSSAPMGLQYPLDELPWIVPMREKRRDDVRVAWEEGDLATEEMDDELFIRGEEVETWRMQ
uniref:Uncharacterized protein n=1 Tax=Oryza meridionalis TaxID=40149 RepID=A0A0E0CLX3_9ORYZ